MKAKLIKEVNRLYFVNYMESSSIDKKMFPINDESDIYLGIQEFRDEFDTEFLNIIEDINVDEPSLFVSELGISLEKKRLKLQNEFLSNFTCSDTIKEVIRLLQYSRNSCIVGGAVRDTILGKKPKDIDFATDLDIDTIERLFIESGFKVQSEGKQFLVIIVSKNGEQIEIAQFRKDKDNNGGEVGDIYEDSKRRDFGIGTGYVTIEHDNMQLLDPSGQFVDDMLDNTIKFVGKPENRLDEDPLRAYRFMRFVQRGFKADKKSLKAVRKNWDKCTKKLSTERIRMEVEKMAGL